MPRSRRGGEGGSAGGRRTEAARLRYEAARDQMQHATAQPQTTAQSIAPSDTNMLARFDSGNAPQTMLPALAVLEALRIGYGPQNSVAVHGVAGHRPSFPTKSGGCEQGGCMGKGVHKDVGRRRGKCVARTSVDTLQNPDGAARDDSVPLTADQALAARLDRCLSPRRRRIRSKPSSTSPPPLRRRQREPTPFDTNAKQEQ